MDKYSAIYFGKTKEIIKSTKEKLEVTLQFFQRHDNATLAGIDEAIEFLKKNSDISKYKINYLPEGSNIMATEVVLELIGNYEHFGIYEGVIDGILARATSLATNAKQVVEAANGKTVICMADRADHYRNQEGDGHAFAIGGIKTQVTKAQITHHDGVAVGTMPHALIQMFEGDLVKALEAYNQTFPEEKLTALVDFNNDIITDSLKAFKAFGDKLGAIRIDTSPAVSDAMFLNDEEFGVTPNMIKTIRKILDKAGAGTVKIIISSGLNPDSIRNFEKENAPVDIYGVGAFLLKIKNTFTADAVKVNGKEIAKVGRSYKKNDKLISLSK